MKRIIFLALLTLPYSIHAEVTADIARCAKISDKEDRLDCYDTVAAYYKQHGAARPQAPVAPIAGSAANSIPASQSHVAVPQASDSEDSFGRIAKQTNTTDSITTNIVGEFKGWKKGAIIELSNGQRWKVVSSSAGYVNMQDPEVKISKGFLGSFKMKVDGLNAAAKVKRIEKK